MTFTATEIVPEEMWDFRPHVEAGGTIPEPSRERLEEFQRGLLELADESRADARAHARAAGEDEGTAEQALTEQYDISGKQWDRALDLVVGICHGSPTREQIDGLPGRVQKAFVEHVIGLFGPEVVSGGTPS